MPESAQPQATRATSRRVHEGSDVDVRAIALTGAALTAGILLACGVAAIMQRHLGPERPREPVARAAPAGPHLQTEPLQDIDRLRREAAARLDGYGWVDRDRGVVRIPIGRAMELLQARAGASGAEPAR
jgi:hypothetical protein